MSNTNRDFIADVMSGDEAQNSNSETHRNYDISDDETVVAREDATLSNLLSESENIVRSLSNLSTYKASIIDDKEFERKPWQSLYSLRPHQNAYLPTGVRSIGTSDYVSDELLLPPSARTHHLDSRSHLYSNQHQVQTFSNTSSLLQTLKDELVMRTSELHKTENEYFNLKANFENLNGRFEHAACELSTLRSQVYSKDKQMRLLTEKVASLNLDLSMSRDAGEVARLELERIRDKREQFDQNSELKNESLTKEVKKRDEVIEQLRNELTENTRNNRTNKTTENSDSQAKEKAMQLETVIKTKEQKILVQQRQIVEYEHEIQGLKEANLHASNSKSEIGHLEKEMELLKEQLDNSRIKNDSINETLLNSKRFYDEFKETSEKSIQDYIRITQKLKTDYRELEEKHRESLNTLKQRGDSNKRLNDDIKELTDKLKCLENVLSEKDKSVHSLNLENIEGQQKIESLRSQLVEGSITETNINLLYKKEVENKQSYIEQLSKETVQLNRAIDELNDKLRIRDSSIEHLNNKLVDLESLKCSHQKSIQNLEENIYQLTHRGKMFEEINKEHENKIELLQLDCKNARDQHESAQDEINKISSEKREFERDLQRKEERMLQENQSRTYEIDGLYLELKKVNQMLTIEKESGQHLTSEIEKLLKEYNKLNNDFERLSEELESKESVYNEMSEKEKRLLNHNCYLEEELTKVKLALEDSSEELEKIRKSWDSREDALAMCKEESSRQKANNLDLISKIEQRDQLLQSLTTETGKLKQKYQNKTSELSKLSDQNTRLKEALQELESSSTGLHQKYEEMKNKKEKEINQLKTELEDIQNQYSNCYDELIQKQEYSTKCQTMEKESAMKLTKLHEEMSQQQMDYDEMEAELNVIRAKHRACQEELSRRDEELMLLKSEVQNYQRDILSFQSERPTFQKEIDRWREKFTDLQERFQHHQLDSDSMEDNISQKDHKIDELLGDLQVTKQENINNLRIIDQLKADLTLSKSTNSDRYNHFQAIIESLKAETATKNQEARFLEENCSKYRNEISRLKSEHESLSQSAAVSNEQLEYHKEKLNGKDDECQHWIQQTQSAQYLNEEVKISLDTLEKEITQVKQQLDIKESKLRSQADVLTKLKNEKNQHYKSFVDCQRQLDMTSRDKEQIEKLLEENVIKMKKYEKCIRDLNEELAVAQVELSNYSNKITRLESELSQTSMITTHKQSIVETLEGKLAKMKSNLNNFKKTHSCDDSEVEDLNSLLLQHTKRCAELDDSLKNRNREREMMVLEKEKRDKEILEFKETILTMKSDIENLRREKEEKCSQFDDIQKKYQYEIKKVKAYSKEVEEDMRSLHNTIDDMQRQSECKNIELDKVSQRSQLLDEDLEQRKKEIVHLEQRLREYEIDKRHCDSLNNVELCRQTGLQKEFEQQQNEIKESRSLILDLTNQKAKFETKCTSLEMMLGKAEKKLSQSDSELKRIQTSFFAYSRELEELRQQHQSQAIILEKTKDQYGRFTEEYNALKGEKLQEKKKSIVIGSEIESLKMQIVNHLDNVNMLKEQVEQQEAVIIELQNELLHERKKVLDLQSNEYQKKKAINEMENETDALSRTRQDLKSKLWEKERLANAKQSEIEKLSTKLRQLTESMIDKDNKIKLLEKRMQLMEEENIQMRQLAQIDATSTPRQMTSDRSEYVNQLESTITNNQSQLEQLRSEIRQSNKRNYELSTDMQMLEDDMQRLKEEKAALQTRISSISLNNDDSHLSNNRLSQYLDDENESLQRIVKKLRSELEEKDQLLSKNQMDSVKNLTLKLSQDQDHDSNSDNRIKNFKYDLELKDKEILELKEMNEKLKKENVLITSELTRSDDTIKTVQGQNTTIVDNFNTWVHEQKAANERLGDKIREQNKTIQDLKKDNELLQRDKHNITSGIHTDRDISSSSSSCNNERILFKNELRSVEENYERIIQGKNKIIEELYGKVNDQIAELSKLKQQHLIMQNDQRTLNIKFDRRKSGHRETPNSNDGDTNDKQYWIKRVGELSDELQQCRDYWSNKVRELSNNIESSSVSVDTLTPISS